MKLSKFLELFQHGELAYKMPSNLEVKFVGMKWQEECHPSAELFPIEFVDAKLDGNGTVIIKFITTKHNQ